MTDYSTAAVLADLIEETEDHYGKYLRWATLVLLRNGDVEKAQVLATMLEKS